MTDSGNKKTVFVLIEDHESSLLGTVEALQTKYPEVDILTAQNSQRAKELINSCSPALVISDLVLPESTYDKPKASTGRDLLRFLLTNYPTMNIVVQSAEPTALIRLKGMYEVHQGSFAIVGKNQPMKDFLRQVDAALMTKEGHFHTPRNMNQRIEIREEWMQALHLAFELGLKDSEIAKRMNVAERTVQNYFQKTRDSLDVQLEDGQSFRSQLAIKAREKGFID